MRKKFGFVVFFISIAFVLRAEESFPLEDRAVVGKLPNGLTYYVQKNSFPKESAVIRLVIKAGSLHEEEEERGIAHFLEHMCFHGSKNVKDWEMIRYLESIGAKFGADTNAHTTFGHTTYELDLPNATKEVLERGLFILGDMAGRLTLDPEIIAKERKIVMDEYNLSKNVNTRLSKEFYRTFCKDSLYNERMPIGLKEVIMTADVATIRGFYERMYRPERMALIVVGDFDVREVESYIESHFSYLEASKEEIEEPSYKIDLPKERVVKGFIDREIPFHTIALYLLEERYYAKNLTRDGVKYGLMESLLQDCIEARLEKASRKNPPPFLGAGIGSVDFAEGYQTLFLGASYFEDRPLDALKGVYKEIEKMRQIGPSEEEVANLIAAYRESFSRKERNEGRREHEEFADRYIDNFLEGRPFYRGREINLAMQEILEEITPEDIRLFAEENFPFEAFHIFFTASKKGALSEEMVEESLAALENIVIEKEEEALFEDLEVAIDKRDFPYLETKEGSGYTVLSLNNGLRVILQPTNLEKDQVVFLAFAPGGKTLFSKEDYKALSLANDYKILKGVGNLNGEALSRYLQERNISYSISVFPNLRKVRLTGSAKYFEDYCRLFLATFQAKERDQDALENLIIRTDEALKQERNNPLFVFKEKVREILFSSNPFYEDVSKERVVVEDVEKALQKLFSSPSDYTLVIVGDFSVEEVKPLLLAYLNGEVKEVEKETYKLPDYSFPKEDRRETIHVGIEAPCLNYVVYGVTDFNMAPKAFLYPLEGLSLLLEERLLAKFRLEMGESYSCHAMADFPLYPDYRDLLFYFHFTCEEGKEALLQEALQKEIENLLTEEITDQELNTIVSLLKADAKKTYQYNRGWVGAYQDLILWDLPLLFDDEHNKEIDRMVTKENIKEMAKLLFQNRSKVEITRCSDK
ncbi:MAG: insulinase family protein [Verrucomicrobia bacterium]|nr:insulinase family protein [Verrucomicrobiota bacterium]